MKRLLVLVVLLAACGAPAADSAARGSDAATTPQPTGGTVRGGVPVALDWTVDRLGGGQIDGGDLAGRDVVLWFWAPW